MAVAFSPKQGCCEILSVTKFNRKNEGSTGGTRLNMPRVLALAGGVGGAKLVFGLTKILESGSLDIVVNTGDDEEFYGLHVSPDLDTVMYTLGGISNTETGWGIKGESFRTLERLQNFGADSWFNLGDLDFATHIRRTQLLGEGKTLSQVTRLLSSALGIEHIIAPMTDGRVRTVVGTEMGEMSFQEYFVRNQCTPVVKSLRFEGSCVAKPSSTLEAGLNESDMIVFCPSNPFLSVDPILSLPGVREGVEGFPGTRIAVSPIVGGKAIKGPAAKMLSELRHEVSALGVARRYVGLCDVFVIDNQDRDLAQEISKLGMRAVVVATVMRTDKDKIDLAKEILKMSCWEASE